MVVGALVGGAFALIGGFAGGLGLDALRTRKAGTIAARLLFLEMLGNLRRYMDWRNEVITRFDPLMLPGAAGAFVAQTAVINGMRIGEPTPPDQFFPAAAKVVRHVTGEEVEPPAFEVTAWQQHAAAFTAAAPSETLGLVHGAYYAVIHDEPTYDVLRRGLDAVGEMAYAAPVDPLSLVNGRP